MSLKTLAVGLCGSLLAVAFAVAPLGCDGKTELGVPGTGGAPASGGGGSPLTAGTGGMADTAGTGGAAGAGAPDGGLPTGCPPAGIAITPTTADDMRAALTRRWLLCSPLGLFSQAQVGVDITSADRYFMLAQDATGALVEQPTADFAGTVTYIDLDPSFGGGIQVNFGSDLGGTIITRPVITSNPTMLIINNEGVYEYRYLAADGS